MVLLVFRPCVVACTLATDCICLSNLSNVDSTSTATIPLPVVVVALAPTTTLPPLLLLLVADDVMVTSLLFPRGVVPRRPAAPVLKTAAALISEPAPIMEGVGGGSLALEDGGPTPPTIG